MGYNQSDCALLGTNNATNETRHIEEKVQPVASIILMSHRIIGSVIPILLSFIIGPWSNKHGRKPFLLSSFIGIITTYVYYVIKLYGFYYNPQYIINFQGILLHM